MIGTAVSLALALPVLGMPLATPFVEDERQHVYGTVAMDPALLFGVGYGHVVRLGDGEGTHRLALGYDLRTVPSLTSWDLRGSVGTRWFGAPGLDVAFGVDLELKWLTNPVHDGLSLNSRFTVAPGYFGKRWFIVGELSSQLALTSVIWHSEAYRDLYSRVHDGFLPPGAPYWYAGARGGVALGPVVTDLGFAWRFAGDFVDKAPYLVPYTVDLRLGYGF